MVSYRSVWAIVLVLFVSTTGCSDEGTTSSSKRYSELSDSTFTVGDSSTLGISVFAGGVTVTPGNAGTVQVAIEKWASKQADLDKIEVEMTALQNGVQVEATNPSRLTGVSVDAEVTAPPDARPSIQVAAGSISYEGLAEGQCSFTTAAGNITLILPANVNVEVHLSVAAGVIQLGFPVVGQVSERAVDGVIGSGADGAIIASVGSGQIVVRSQ